MNHRTIPGKPGERLSLGLGLMNSVYAVVYLAQCGVFTISRLLGKVVEKGASLRIQDVTMENRANRDCLEASSLSDGPSRINELGDAVLWRKEDGLIDTVHLGQTKPMSPYLSYLWMRSSSHF
jgi:hypothetical protein